MPKSTTSTLICVYFFTESSKMRDLSEYWNKKIPKKPHTLSPIVSLKSSLLTGFPFLLRRKGKPVNKEDYLLLIDLFNAVMGTAV